MLMSDQAQLPLQYFTGGKYGSGLTHDYNPKPKNADNEVVDGNEDGSGLDTPDFNPAAWGEERCPSLHLMNDGAMSGDGMQYHTVLSDWTLYGCACGDSKIVAEVDDFPPDEEVLLSVYGTRKGDTGNVSVTVEQAGPLVLSVDGDCGALNRIHATGCLNCRGDEP
jgi:hypothetical protein